MHIFVEFADVSSVLNNTRYCPQEEKVDGGWVGLSIYNGPEPGL